MSFIVSSVVVAGATLYSSHKQRKAQKKAQKDAKKDQLEAEKQARKSEVFAQTEGQGLGQMGQVSLEVDEDLEKNEKVGTSVRI